MREVNSQVIKAYARSLEALSVTVENDLVKLVGEHSAESFKVRIHEVAKDLLLTARDIALKEFSDDWGKV